MRKFNIDDYVIVNKSHESGKVIEIRYDYDKKRSVYSVLFDDDAEIEYVARELSLDSDHDEKTFEKDFDGVDSFTYVRGKLEIMKKIINDIEEEIGRQ